uniref:Uncharacterized protein n=1 Tax=Cacopsylla melanoneura TaxID=428564 RepID=A0A8D8UTK0_9HEMI
MRCSMAFPITFNRHIGRYAILFVPSLIPFSNSTSLAFFHCLGNSPDVKISLNSFRQRFGAVSNRIFVISAPSPSDPVAFLFLSLWIASQTSSIVNSGISSFSTSSRLHLSFSSVGNSSSAMFLFSSGFSDMFGRSLNFLQTIL